MKDVQLLHKNFLRMNNHYQYIKNICKINKSEATKEMH